MVQNDLLKAAADVIFKEITDKVKEAEGFAVIADEARDISKKEQLTVCLRYVNNKLVKDERFVGFSDLCDLDAKALAEKIVDSLQVLGLAMYRSVLRRCICNERPGIWCSTKAQGDCGKWMCLYSLPCT